MYCLTERNETASGVGPDCGRRVPDSWKSDTLTFTTFCTAKCARLKICPGKLQPFYGAMWRNRACVSIIQEMFEIYHVFIVITYKLVISMYKFLLLVTQIKFFYDSTILRENTAFFIEEK